MAARNSTGYRPSDREINRLFSQLENAGPLMSEEELETLDRDFRSVSNVRKRRASFYFLTLSGADLMQRIVSDGDCAVAAAAVAQFAKGYGEYLHGIANLVESARTRIEVALCNRADMPDILARARKNIDAQPDVEETDHAPAP